MQIAPRFLPPFFISAGIPKVNWSHPITNGLVGVWVPGIAQFNIIDAALLSLQDTTTTSLRAGPFGAAWHFTGGANDSGFKSLGSPYLTNAGGLNASIFSLAEVDSAAPAGNVFGANIYGERAAAGNDLFKLDFNYGTGGATDRMQFVLRDDANTQFLQVNSSVTPRDGLYHSWLATKSGTSVILYKDGVQDSTGSWTAPNNFTDAGRTATIGYDITDTSGAFPGSIVIVAVWTRTLSPIEAVLLVNDPFCMLTFPEEFVAVTLVGVQPFAFVLMPQIVT